MVTFNRSDSEEPSESQDTSPSVVSSEVEPRVDDRAEYDSNWSPRDSYKITSEVEIGFSLVVTCEHSDDPGTIYEFSWGEDADRASRYEQLDTWARDIHRKVEEGHALRPLPTPAD